MTELVVDHQEFTNSFRKNLVDLNNLHWKRKCKLHSISVERCNAKLKNAFAILCRFYCQSYHWKCIANIFLPSYFKIYWKKNYEKVRGCRSLFKPCRYIVALIQYLHWKYILHIHITHKIIHILTYTEKKYFLYIA